LLVCQKPDRNLFNENYYNTYENILEKTNAMQVNYDLNHPKPTSSRGEKWKNIFSPFWHSKKNSSSSGTGIQSTGFAVVIPSDPNALLTRL
jgi:hypothetical protein